MSQRLKNLFECRICKKKHYKLIGYQTDKIHKHVKGNFATVKCTKCGLTQQLDRLNDDNSADYSDGYAFYKKNSKPKKLFKFIFNFVINTGLLNYLPLSGKILRLAVRNLSLGIEDPLLKLIKYKNVFLDVGCGSGQTTHIWGENSSLAQLKKRGFQVAGLEFNKSCHEILSNSSIPYFKDIDEVPSKSYDLIRLNWVLEHIDNPLPFLSKCVSKLKPKGRIIICVPNYDGWLYRAYPLAIEVPIHRIHLRHKDIRNLFKLNKIKEEMFYTFSYPALYLASMNYKLIPGKPSCFIKDFRNLSTFMETLDVGGLGNDIVVIGKRI